MSHEQPLLARQPIFDKKMQVVAYELLYRDDGFNRANVTDGDIASSQVLLNTFTEPSLQKIVGEKQAFINFTSALLSASLPFDTSQLVIEVLESETITELLIEKLQSLKENGFTIALDDFVLTQASAKLIPYASIIKIDVLALTKQQTIDHVNHLKPLGVKILAEKIETHAVLEECKDLGFDLFQGYFLEKPQILKGKKLDNNKQAIVHLLSKLHDPEVKINELQTLISYDPVFSLKLLRLVNSSAFSISKNIESLHQAIMLLGLKIIRDWVSLLAMSKLEDKPLELCVKTLCRAKLCELMASATRPQHQCDSFFTVGILSTLGIYMDSPLENILQDINLSPSIHGALLNFSGEEGQFLKVACAYENGQWDSIDWDYLSQFQITPGTLTTFYLETLEWVDTAQNSILND